MTLLAWIAVGVWLAAIVGIVALMVWLGTLPVEELDDDEPSA